MAFWLRMSYECPADCGPCFPVRFFETYTLRGSGSADGDGSCGKRSVEQWDPMQPARMHPRKKQDRRTNEHVTPSDTCRTQPSSSQASVWNCCLGHANHEDGPATLRPKEPHMSPSHARQFQCPSWSPTEFQSGVLQVCHLLAPSSPCCDLANSLFLKPIRAGHHETSVSSLLNPHHCDNVNHHTH